VPCEKKKFLGLFFWASLWCIISSPKTIISSCSQKCHTLLTVLQSVTWISCKMFSIKIKCPSGNWQKESTSPTGGSSFCNLFLSLSVHLNLFCLIKTPLDLYGSLWQSLWKEIWNLQKITTNDVTCENVYNKTRMACLLGVHKFSKVKIDHAISQLIHWCIVEFGFLTLQLSFRFWHQERRKKKEKVLSKGMIKTQRR